MVFTGKMPDVTAAQIGAILTFVVSQIVAWGWITNHTGQRVVSVGGIVVALVWKLADAYLRGQRAKAVAANPSLVTPTPAAK